MKNIAVIGATGSVGSAVMDVCREHKDKLKVCALAAGHESEKLKSLAEEFCVPASRVFNYERDGSRGLINAALDEQSELVVFASSGTAAIPALQAALKSKKQIALANKESIVVAGPWVMPLVDSLEQLRPLDSEHNAIWQCLHGESKNNIARIILTASGGPFRNFSKAQLECVTVEMALKHPVWSMGAKISVDSATLMNKGIELIEARYLFGLRPVQVSALISPGSFVHGLIEFNDGGVKMLAAAPDMRFPAASCLFWPERCWPCGSFERPSLVEREIRFEQPDEGRFPAIALARRVMEAGGVYPAVLVGADEVAVDAFVRGRIKFTRISELVESVLAACALAAPESLGDALAAVEWAQRRCRALAAS